MYVFVFQAKEDNKRTKDDQERLSGFGDAENTTTEPNNDAKTIQQDTDIILPPKKRVCLCKKYLWFSSTNQCKTLLTSG